MSTYRVRSGDTLWAISQRFGTSVDALMKANPQIKNRALIITGQTLQVPGGKDDFVPPRPVTVNRPARPAAPSAPSVPAGGGPDRRGGSSAAFDIAQRYLGWNAGALKRAHNAVGEAMFDWVPNNVNCANFVSGVLVAAGQMKKGQVDSTVTGLMDQLDRTPGFRRVSLKDARPGDVVAMKTRSGHHVVLFAGWRNGRPVFLGSNNVNRDGSQRITQGQFSYPILAIYQYQR